VDTQNRCGLAFYEVVPQKSPSNVAARRQIPAPSVFSDRALTL